MLNQVIANMLVENRHHFMIAADMVATVSENNPLSHAFLVLTRLDMQRFPCWIMIRSSKDSSHYL